MKIYKFKVLGIAALMSLLATACDSYSDRDMPDTLSEKDKNLAGVWQLSQVKRNSIDITSTMDFGKFLLHLNPDNSYELEHRYPFPVSKDGTWTVDDPAHPFQLSFKEGDADRPVDVAIQYPIVQGTRQLTITHSPGCYRNKYEYIFVKVN